MSRFLHRYLKQELYIFSNEKEKNCILLLPGYMIFVNKFNKDMQYKRIILYSSIKMKKEAFASNHRKCLQNMVT